MSNETEAAASATAEAAAAASVTSPWHEGMSAEDLGWLENKGFKLDDPKAATQAAIKSYREVETKFGIPADKIVRWPDGPDDATHWAAVRERMGVPATDAEYDLSAVKLEGGADLDPAFTDWAKKTAHSLALPKDAATKLAASVVSFAQGRDKEAATAGAEALAASQGKLKTDWGANYDANLLVARNAMRALGVTEAVEKTIEAAGVGYDGAMELFRKIGASIGEDKFVQSLNGNGSGIKTREGAAAELLELKSDTEACKRYLAGDRAEIRKWNELHVIISGDDTEDSRRRAGK